MPQDSNAAPGRFVKVISEVIKNLDRVAAYLDDVVVFYPDPMAHVANIRPLVERLRNHKLELSPAKVKLSAADADFLGHIISSSGVSPHVDKVAALTRRPCPRTRSIPVHALEALGAVESF